MYAPPMRQLPALFAFSLTLTASSLALADEPPPEPEKKEEKKDEKKDEAKKGGCSIVDDNDAMIGLAGLVLLLSGVALRRAD